jgi:threonine dehydrogenase-like Zn-dependent dehydrogenase
MKSKAMVQVDDRRLELIEHPVPALPTGGALLRVEACGLCGSDVAQYDGEPVRTGVVSYPVIPGHEPVGIIEDIHPDAQRLWNLRVGDRVAVEPHLSCGLCQSCLTGSYHMCRRVRPSGGLSAYGYMPLTEGHGLWGGYSEYLALSQRTVLHKLPDNMSARLASLYQAIAAGVRWAVQLPETAMGDRALILGAGQRGLGAVVACREAGASQIIVTGRSSDRHKMSLARTLGAHAVIDVDTENTVDRVGELTAGRGVDVVVDTVPLATAPLLDAVEVARPGATIILGGLKGSNAISLLTDRILFKELIIKGAYSQGAEAYIEAFRLLDRYSKDLMQLHTHAFPLEEAETAIRTLGGRVAGEEAISVCLIPGLNSHE